MKWATCAALTLVALGGCASASMRNISAGHTGCRASEIQIESKRRGWATATWVAVCRGQRFQCSGSSSNTQCAPLGGAVEREYASGPQTAPAPRPAAPSATVTNPSDAITREVVGGDPTLIARMSFGDIRLGLGVRPLSHPETVWLRATNGSAPPSGCRLQLMVDGTLVGVGATNIDGLEVVATAEAARVARIADGNRVVGRYCGQEFRFTDHHRAIVAELRARFSEERAFAQSRSTETPRQAPHQEGPPPGEVENPASN